MSDVTVSEAMARYFYEQCAGEHNGSMASMPNNPVLHGLMMAHSVNGYDDFARFLRQVADQLTKEQQF